MIAVQTFSLLCIIEEFLCMFDFFLNIIFEI